MIRMQFTLPKQCAALILGTVACFGLANNSVAATSESLPASARNFGGAEEARAPAAAVRPAVKHSAPYTRLLGPASTVAPARLAQQSAATPAKVQPVHLGHWGAPYYAGYAGYGGPAFYGAGYAFPYYVGGYGGFGVGYGPWFNYRPYVYSYQPWVGGWGGYPYYAAYPGFGGYYSVGYRPYGFGGYGGYYGGYGGCCYW